MKNWSNDDENGQKKSLIPNCLGGQDEGTKRLLAVLLSFDYSTSQ